MTHLQNIEFNGSTYKVGAFFDTVERYEAATGESVSDCTTVSKRLKFFYCSLQACNPMFDLTFEQFREKMNANPGLLAQFETLEINRSGAKPVEPQTEVKKKPNKKKESFGLLMLSALGLFGLVLIPIISAIGVLWMSLRLVYYSIAKAGKKHD